MTLIKTKGRAKQKTLTLAKLAGVEIKDVVFTRPALIKALGRIPDNKKYGMKRDNGLGRCFTSDKVIWLSLPVSLDTIAHEVNHLRTKLSHSTQTFQNQVVALRRGKNPAKAKPQYYEVTITTIVKKRIYELSANDAKTHCSHGEITSRIETKTARKLES